MAHAFEALADRYKLARPSKSAFTEHFSIIAWPNRQCAATGRFGRTSDPASGTRSGAGAPSTWPRAQFRVSSRLGERRRRGAFGRLASHRKVDDARADRAADRKPRRDLARGELPPHPNDDPIAAGSFLRRRAGAGRVRERKKPVQCRPIARPSGRLARGRWAPTVSDVAAVIARALRRGTEHRACQCVAPETLGRRRATPSRNGAEWRPVLGCATTPPVGDMAAYPDAATVFGGGSDVALALAARTVEWNSCLVFEPNEERARAEQRFTPLTGERVSCRSPPQATAPT